MIPILPVWNTVDNTAELNIWSTTRNIAGQYSFSGSPNFYDFSGTSSCTSPLDITTCGSWRFAMEIICLFFILGFTADELLEFCREWKSHGRFFAYYDDGMNYFESASVFLFWFQVRFLLLFSGRRRRTRRTVFVVVLAATVRFRVCPCLPSTLFALN